MLIANTIFMFSLFVSGAAYWYVPLYEKSRIVGKLKVPSISLQCSMHLKSQKEPFLASFL